MTSGGKACLLVQLGTPDAPTPSAVGRFLTEFLGDGRVITLPWLWRQLLVRGVIVPFRRKASAKAYQAVWTHAGSPLRVHSEALVTKVQAQLGDEMTVALAMRYGQPSMSQVLDALMATGCDELAVLPLFPQYASATTASVFEVVMRYFAGQNNVPTIQWVHDFFDQPDFIAAWVHRIQRALGNQAIDHLLFSYHGLPVSQVKASESGNVPCDQVAPCPAMQNAGAYNNRYCYRAQCYATTRAITQHLPEGLAHSVSFQSRLGRVPWIKPYTEVHLQSLFDQGVRHLAVVSPAFVADCLETIEELGMRAKDQWLAMGGASFTLVPCLNADQLWVQAVAARCSGSSHQATAF